MLEIPETESLTVEFKSAPKSGLQDKTVIDAVVGMANTNGGVIYVGVADDGSVSGIEDRKIKWADPAKAKAFIYANTMPPVAAETEVHDVEGRLVLMILVPRASGLVSTMDGRFLERRMKFDKSPGNFPIYSYRIAHFLAQQGMFDYTATVVPGSSMEDLNPKEREHMRKAIAENVPTSYLLQLSDEDLDRVLGLVHTFEDGTTLPTVCGLLLIGHEERIRALLPNEEVVFQRLAGTIVQKTEELRLPLIRTYEVLMDRLTDVNPETELMEGFYREGIPDFSPAAYREGVLNALIHRDYTLPSRISVCFDDEGYTITSPGGFMRGITLDNLLTVEPRYRNPRLANAMSQIGLVERAGRGIDLIFEDSIVCGREWPDYSDSTDDSVCLIQRRRPMDVEFYRMIKRLKKIRGASTMVTLMILSALQMHGVLSKTELAEKTHYKPELIAFHLGRLEEEGFVERLGSKRSGFMISRSVYAGRQTSGRGPRREPNLKEPVSSAEETLLDAAFRKGPLARRDAMSLLNISDKQAYGLLSRLCERGLLEAVGNRKARRYRFAQ